MMPHLRADQYLSCFLFFCVGLLLPLYQSVEAKELEPITRVKPLPELSRDFQYAVKKNTSATEPLLTARAVIVYDQSNGAILYEKAMDQKLPEASLTKLMTALVAIETYDLGEEIEITYPVTNTENNVMGLQVGELITVENLLKGLLIFSANDAALALEYHHPEGSAGFIKAMNQKAQALHLSQTSFRNTPGFDDPGHYSTTFDLAILGKAVLENPKLTSIMQTEQELVTDVTGTIQHPLQTTNQLLNNFSGLVAGKTGSTPLAGGCLITQVNREGHPIITVVLGSQDRFKDTANLVNWVYNYFEWKTPIEPF
jgi:D-alanyl-D-alanine carboxypeptidase (penicillin-binding protein 5/6)